MLESRWLCFNQLNLNAERGRWRRICEWARRGSGCFPFLAPQSAWTPECGGEVRFLFLARRWWVAGYSLSPSGGSTQLGSWAGGSLHLSCARACSEPLSASGPFWFGDRSRVALSPPWKMLLHICQGGLARHRGSVPVRAENPVLGPGRGWNSGD